MSTTDPLHDALERLARHADHDPAPDRLAGITRRHRAQRHRRAAVGAGVATLAVVATGLAVGSLPGAGDDASRLATPGPSPSTRLGIDVSLGIEPADPAKDTYRVTYDVDGTALAVRDPATGDPIDHGGPLGTSVLLDGKNVGGSDGGLVECDPVGRSENYDERFGPVEVTIPPGRHTVAVVVEYCGADGQRETARASDSAEYLGTVTVADRARKDLDGDGTPERLVVVDEGTDSALHVTGSVNGTVSLQAADATWISGVEDLDGDGDLEVLVDARWRSVTATVVVTLDGGRPALVTSPAEGPRRYTGAVDGDFHGTMVIDGVLTTWEGRGDGERVGPVDGGTWVLEGTRLHLVPFARPMCASVEVSPRPC